MKQFESTADFKPLATEKQIFAAHFRKSGDVVASIRAAGLFAEPDKETHARMVGESWLREESVQFAIYQHTMPAEYLRVVKDQNIKMLIAIRNAASNRLNDAIGAEQASGEKMDDRDFERKTTIVMNAIMMLARLTGQFKEAENSVVVNVQNTVSLADIVKTLDSRIGFSNGAQTSDGIR